MVSMAAWLVSCRSWCLQLLVLVVNFWMVSLAAMMCAPEVTQERSLSTSAHDWGRNSCDGRVFIILSCLLSGSICSFYGCLVVGTFLFHHVGVWLSSWHERPFLRVGQGCRRNDYFVALTWFRILSLLSVVVDFDGENAFPTNEVVYAKKKGARDSDDLSTVE